MLLFNLYVSAIFTVLMSIATALPATEIPPSINSNDDTIKVNTNSSPVQHTHSEQLVNINSATVKQLMQQLDGVGKKRAQAIFDYRQQHGPFIDKSDLLKVKGIGKTLFTLNQSKIRLSDKASTP